MIKTIVISGPESSGKTWLAKHLAEFYEEPLVLEYARDYLTKTKGHYTANDLIDIAAGQISQEQIALPKAKKIIIQDTGLVDIQVWSIVKYGKSIPSLESELPRDKHTFYILCAPNIPYKADGLRENPSINKRVEIFNTFLSLLKSKKNFLGIIDSPKKFRLKKAIELIHSKIK